MRIHHKLATALVVVTASTAALLSGCRVGYPFRGPGYDAGRGVIHPGAGEEVLVALTRGDIAAGGRERFSKRLGAVLDTIGEQDGLIGYAVRREVFGSRVWTMSAWIDRASMERFVRSPAHREAIAQGGIPRASFSSVIVNVPREQLPIAWQEVERLLDPVPERE